MYGGMNPYQDQTNRSEPYGTTVSPLRADRLDRVMQTARGQLQEYEDILDKEQIIDTRVLKIQVDVDNTRLRKAFKCTMTLRLVADKTLARGEQTRVLDSMPQR